MNYFRDLLGMYAFGLEETNMYAKAEQTAKQVKPYFICLFEDSSDYINTHIFIIYKAFSRKD